MIISVSNLKGGCGKTTLATNLAVSFAKKGKSVCLIDTDLGQNSALEWSGNRGEGESYISVVGKALGQITKDAIALSKQYDIVLIDGAPQLEELADRTILASDIVLIPMKNSLIDFRSTENFLGRFRKIKDLKESQNLGELKAFIIMNEASTNTKAYKDIKEAVERLQEPLFHTIPVRTAYRDAFMYGLGVVEYDDPKAKAEIEELTDKLETVFQAI